MSSPTPSSMSESSRQHSIMMTLPSPRLSSSFEIMFSLDNSSLASQSHVFQYRSLRPSTPPYPQPTPPYLSCWWTGDSTDFWGRSLETTLPRYSEPLSSHSWRSNGEHITGPMAQWREQCRQTRRMEAHPLTPESICALHALPEHPPLPSPCPPLTPLLTCLPSWPDKPTPSLITLEPPPFPQGNNIVATLCQLNEAREGLTDEVLLEWALDMLCSPKDWRWLWSLEPAEIPSSSPTRNQPPPPWYDASNSSPLNMSALSMSAPFVTPLLPDIPNGPASCDPAPSVENLAMWAPVAQPQPQLARPLFLPEWVTWEDLESMSQGYKGGNVMVEEAPTPFSPFSLVDCTLLSHFSFDDFITVAFPDLAGDLDTQI